jgi:hypothetical protein
MMTMDAFIGHVCHGLGDRAEERWGVLPPHWQYQRECNEWLIGDSAGWYDDTHLWYIGWP